MKRFGVVGLCLLLCLLCVSPLLSVHAEQGRTDKESELRDLLQRGLTIQEIDRELAKLADKDKKLADEMRQNEQEMDQHQRDFQQAKDKMGKVLRSYYTGDRPSLFRILVSTESLSDLFKMMEYMNMIISHDNRVLTTYQRSYQQLQAMQQQLILQREEIAKTKANYIKQKDRIIALQSELDALLAASGNSEEILEEIAALNKQWENEGLPLFNRYLSELSKSLKDFSDLLSTDNFKLTSLNTAIFEINDSQLNSFLRNKNKIFENLTFRFEDESLIADGSDDDIQISIQGTYTMDDQFIRFELISLSFNGFELPDTTIQEMSDQYELGIDPSKVMSFLSAEDIILEKGLLTIKLKMSF